MNNTNANNTSPSSEQYQRSLKLLAFNVAQYREKHQQIPLINALPFIAKDDSTTEDKAVYSQGNKIYAEALSLVDSGLAPPTKTSVRKENRTQPRISISTSLHIKAAASGQKSQGTLENISWGGLSVRTKESLGKEKDVVVLSLPYPDDEDIRIKGIITRFYENDGMYITAIRFSVLSRKNETKLNKLLNLMLNEGDGKRRKDIRFSHQIDISYWDAEELKATLEDISRGGMLVTMPDPVELGKSIKVQLNGTDDLYRLNLRARVIRQETIEISDYKMYQMALQFEHPTEELRLMVQGVMQGLLEKSKKKVSQQTLFTV